MGERGIVVAIVLLLALGGALAAVALLLLAGRPSTLVRLTSALVGAFAGGVIGACLSILVSRALDYSALAQMRQTLERTVASSLTSPDHDLERLRRVWHHYHTTLVDGRTTWRYTVFRFDNHATVGSLVADVSEIAADGSTHSYHVAAAARGSRLILVQTTFHGKEAPAIEVFPHLLYDFRPVHAGVGVMQSWDSDEVLSSILLSHRPLTDAEEPGSLSASDAAKLDAIWRESFTAVRDLLPARRAPASLATPATPQD